MGFPPWEIRVAFLGESQLRQSRLPNLPTVHAGCFSVSIIHRTLTWTTGSLTCAQMLIHAIEHGGVRTHVRESVLKVESGRKIPSRPGESNCVNGVTVRCSNQLSCISHPMFLHNKYYKGQSVKLLRTCKAYLVRCSCSRDLGEAGHS